MCLSNVYATYNGNYLDKDPNQWKMGYKVFSVMYIRSIDPYLVFPVTNQVVYTNHILRSEAFLMKESLGYPMGFHIWPTLEIARSDIFSRNEIVIQVQYKKVLAVGDNCAGPIQKRVRKYDTCVVAHEIFVIIGKNEKNKMRMKANELSKM